MAAFHKIEEALEDLKKGKIILVTDDAERENEGDFICAAQFATTENINFMPIRFQEGGFGRWRMSVFQKI